LGPALEKFSRQFRLITKADYKRVFNKAHKTSDRYFVVLWRPGTFDNPRLGLAISKKHLKRAVDRNRIKRLIRESFRKRRAAMPAVDIVVLAGRQIIKAEGNEITDSLEKRWDSIQIPISK